MNLLQYPVIPRKVHTSPLVVGILNNLIAWIFVHQTMTHVDMLTCTKLTFLGLDSQLSSSRSSEYNWKVLRCCSQVSLKIAKSSMYDPVKVSSLWITESINLWKVAGAPFRPNGMTLNWESL